MKVKTITPENLQKAWDEGCSDVKKVLENLYPDFFEKNEVYQSGDRFEIWGTEYILAIADRRGTKNKNEMVLINLKDGCRAESRSFTVEFSSMATHKEIQNNLGGTKFKKIEK